VPRSPAQSPALQIARISKSLRGQTRGPDPSRSRSLDTQVGEGCHRLPNGQAPSNPSNLTCDDLLAERFPEHRKRRKSQAKSRTIRTCVCTSDLAHRPLYAPGTRRRTERSTDASVQSRVNRADHVTAQSARKVKTAFAAWDIPSESAAPASWREPRSSCSWPGWPDRSRWRKSRGWRRRGRRPQAPVGRPPAAAGP
jgi:hypothetical protein